MGSPTRTVPPWTSGLREWGGASKKIEMVKRKIRIVMAKLPVISSDRDQWRTEK